MGRGENRKALGMVRRAAERDPGRALYWSMLGLLTARTGGCLREAVRHCQRGYELEPGERRVALSLADLYERVGLHQRALRLRRRHRWGLADLFRRPL